MIRAGVARTAPGPDRQSSATRASRITMKPSFQVLSCRDHGSEAHWNLGRRTVVAMSALGHKRTLFAVRFMSALPPKADISAPVWQGGLVRQGGHALAHTTC